ncbi:MAG: hypothetical protein QM221_03955 [Bacillota bacterium]|nr:hypothetical protein [Bacillota bacterium]
MSRRSENRTKVRKLRPNFYQKKWSERFLNAHLRVQILILILVLSLLVVAMICSWKTLLSFQERGDVAETSDPIQSDTSDEDASSKEESWKSLFIESLEIIAAFASIYFFLIYGLEYIEQKRKTKEERRFKDNRNMLINSTPGQRKKLMDHLEEILHETLPKGVKPYSLNEKNDKTGTEETIRFPAYTLFKDNSPSLKYHSKMLVPDAINWGKVTYYDEDFIDWLKSVLKKNLYNSEIFTLSSWKKDEKGRISFSIRISDYYSMLILGQRFFYGLIYRGYDKDLHRFNMINRPFFNRDGEIIQTWKKENQKLIALHPDYAKPDEDGIYGSKEDIYTSIGISCSLLFRRKDKGGREFYTTFIHDKSMTSNVIERYHIIPAGMYQPGSKTQALRDADIKNSILREVAEELYGLREAHTPLSNEFFISHYTDTDEVTLKSEGENALYFRKFLTSNPRFEVVNLSVDVLRAHLEFNCIMVVDEQSAEAVPGRQGNAEFGEFEKHVKSFGLNFETKDLISLDFYKDEPLEKSLQDALIIKNSISELPFVFVSTGMITLHAAYQEAQRLLHSRELEQ